MNRAKSSPPVAAAVITMFATYASVILASMTLPVLAPTASQTLEIPARYIGLYAAILYAGAALSSLAAPNLVARYGALRTSQGALGFAAAGLFALAIGSVPSAVASAVLIGLAYGPGNTASGRLLSAMTIPGKRSGIFSIKQTSVPAGSALCGVAAPLLALVFGWQGAAIAMGFVCLAVSAAVQPWRAVLDAGRDAAHTLLPRKPLAGVALVMRGPRLRALGITGLVYSGMQYAFGAVMVTFFVDRAGVSALEAGLVLSAAMVTSVMARLAWGYVADRTRADVVLGFLGLLTAASVVAAVFVDEGWPRLALIALGCWFGAAGFSWNGVYLALVADIAGPERVAAATSGVMTFVFVGSLAFPALFAGLIAVSGYNAALLSVAAATFVTGIYVYARLSRAK
ncbi:major Facilitator Superfamily protein [bacterium BMS3Bbin10]|nr:major Facilitator Superfamily protein [bacterium BMS3Bbin10]